MFSFWRKKKRLTPAAAARYLVEYVGKSNWERLVDGLVVKHAQYKPLRNQIIDEMQWFALASGVASVLILSDVAKARAVIDGIISIYSRGVNYPSGGRAFTPEALQMVTSRLEAYLVRFNRGIAFRAGDGADDPLQGAIDDVANESMAYVTGRPRSSAIDIDTRMELQDRTAPADFLEHWAGLLFSTSLTTFTEHFQDFDLS